MILTQHYLECLSQASYLIGDASSGRAVVVDPRRDVDEYLEEAASLGLTIERVIETHVHADFVSGHLELAARTGATISYGAGAEVDFDVEPLEDGRRLCLGDVELEILATPGHTPESISIVVRERADAPPTAVLTGDTLFIGDVGRPDLVGAMGHTSEEMAAQLYRSLHERLLALPDETEVLPAHGAGSACGKQLSSERRSTIGRERATNHALAPMPEDRFVAMVTEGLAPPPEYFAYDARRNREDRPVVADAPIPELGLDEVLARVAQGAIALDVRSAQDFAAGHLRGSIHLSLASRFAELAGAVLDPEADLVLVCEPGAAREAQVRLARIGFDRVVGALADPDAALAEHPEHVDRLSRLTATELDERRRAVPALVVLDVRSAGEQEQGTVPGARSAPLTELREQATRLDPATPTVLYCAGGTRSAVAASLLAAEGFEDVSDLLGGYDAYVRAQEAT